MDLRVIVISCHKTNSKVFKKLLMSIGHRNCPSLKLQTLTEWSLPSLTLLRFQMPLPRSSNTPTSPLIHLCLTEKRKKTPEK